MTVQLLSFPFRLNSRGAAVTEDDTSKEYCAGSIAVILGTQPGERPMNLQFGVNDPAFESFSEQALRIQVSRVGLPVEIGNIRRMYLNDAQENVTVQFDMATSIYGGRQQ